MDAMEKSHNKFDFQEMIGSVDSLLTEIKVRWSTFLLHTYCNRQQHEYINRQVVHCSAN